MLVVTPYYNRPSQAGLYEHFRAVAEAAGGLPVVLYDIPVRSGRRIAALHHLAPGPRRAGHRGAQGRRRRTLPAPHTWQPQLPAGFEIYSGDDCMTLPLLAVGAVGVISVASHWVGPQFRAVVDAFCGGDLAEAIAGNAELLESFDFESQRGVPEPPPGQGHLPRHGPPRRAVPPAHGRSTPELDAQAAKILAAVGPTTATVQPVA